MTTETTLTAADYQNLLVLIHRSKFDNLDEAEVAVVLKQKLIKLRDNAAAEEPDGDDVQGTDE